MSPPFWHGLGYDYAVGKSWYATAAIEFSRGLGVTYR